MSTCENIIDQILSLDTNKRSKIKEYLEKNKNKVKNKMGYAILYNNIINSNYIEKNKYKTLGCEHLYMLSDGNRNVLIIGERHTKYPSNFKCSKDKQHFSIPDFITVLVTRNIRPIDVFVESQPFGNHYGYITNEDIDIYRVRRDTHKCVIQDKKDCPYWGTRIHYTDIRYTNKNTRTFNDEYYLMSLFTDISMTRIPIMQFLKIIYRMRADREEYINDLKKYTTEMVSKFFEEYEVLKLGNIDDIKIYPVKDDYLRRILLYMQIMTNIADSISNTFTIHVNQHVKKQINNISDIRVKNKLSELCDKFFRDLFYVLIDISKCFSKIKKAILVLKDSDVISDKHYSDITINFLNEILDTKHKYLNSMYHFVDIFVLSRMFRQFKQVSGKFSEECKDIVFYGGDDHAKDIRDILLSLGFKDTIEFKHENTDKYPVCVDISSFEPFGIKF